MPNKRWVRSMLQVVIAAILSLEMAAAWGQATKPDARILDRAAELHVANPTFRVTLRKAGPFQFGERIFADSNIAEISKRLYPPTHQDDPFEVRRDREAALRFEYAGALLEGPVSCGDFVVPCRYSSFQRSALLHGRPGMRDGWSPINAALPPLTPGKYRLAILLVLWDERQFEAETVSRLKGETIPQVTAEEGYLVSNVMEFEVLPLNGGWVDSRLAALSSLPPPGAAKPQGQTRLGRSPRPILSPQDPLGEILFLPTQATLATAYEYYVENAFEPILATFYYHPDLKLSCQFLMAQISQLGYPLLPKILQQTPHVCVDSVHHYQQYHDAGARSGKAAYYAALQVRFDDYDRFRLQVARLLAERLREEPQNEAALQGFMEATAALYGRTLAAERLKAELAALRPILEPRLRTYSTATQRMLLGRHDLLPDAVATALALKIFEEHWPESVCVEGKLRAEEEYDQWLSLRRAAFSRVLKADPARAKVLIEEMIKRTDPTLNSDLARSLPFAASVPPALLDAVTARKELPSACGMRLDTSVIYQLHLQAIPLDALEDLTRSGTDQGLASASDVLLDRDPKRFAAMILDLLRQGDKRASEFAGLLFWDQRARYEVPPTVFDEIGLALLARPELESQAQGARVLRLGWNDHKKLLTEKYKKIDRALLASGVSESELERAEAAFRDGVSRGRGWLTTKEEIFELDRYCDFDMCKRGLQLDVQYLQPAISMSIDVADASLTQTEIRFAQYHDQESTLYDNEDTLNLIRRYPRDIPIRIRRWTMRAPQRPFDIEMNWRSKLQAEGFIDVEIEMAPF